MTNEEILAFAQSMNYAHLDIESGCCIRYGRERWEQRVPELTPEQRGKLIARIEHWQELVARSCSHGI